MRSKKVLLAAASAIVVGLGGLAVVNAHTASAATDGVFKMTCGYSHTNNDDMILYPNRPGAAHTHDYFGNAGTKANSTYGSLIGVRSTCPVNDTAAYWVPALYQNGRKLNPFHIIVYYNTPVDTARTRVQPFPNDFRMIAGNARNTRPESMGREYWGCGDNTQITHNVPTRCSVDNIQIRITFPSCWNGRQTSGDSAVNMRFPSGGRCPSSHSIALPMMRVNASYRTGTNVGRITLSSGSASSAHADFVNTWDPATLKTLVDRCLNKLSRGDCGRFQGTTRGRNP
ncbi:MAG TPA: DUF1996 domain-containing protein [Micromonosporaceae bacterium]|nr:DUF1996 domain-containing protein [Micromonosporaceae bacterium]